MKTLGEVLRLSTQYLQERNIPNPRRQVEDLISHCLKLSRLEIYMQFDRPLVEEELTPLRALIKRRGQDEPLQYLLEEINFYHCRFLVTPAVLIPRHESELLIDRATAEIKEQDFHGKVAWDVCCGSGCLGISLKKALPELQVFLSDLSEDALEVAKKNREKNQVEVEFLKGDLLQPFKDKKADFVLCNPPYISEKEYASLEPSVRAFEPRMALIGGITGLEFYMRLAQELPLHLNPGGKVFLEIGYNIGPQVSEIFSASCWKTKRLEKDWAGQDRFFFLEFQ